MASWVMWRRNYKSQPTKVVVVGLTDVENVVDVLFHGQLKESNDTPKLPTTSTDSTTRTDEEGAVVNG